MTWAMPPCAARARPAAWLASHLAWHISVDDFTQGGAVKSKAIFLGACDAGFPNNRHLDPLSEFQDSNSVFWPALEPSWSAS